MLASKNRAQGRVGGDRRGFSLIELVVVMVITAVLAAAAASMGSHAENRRRIAARTVVRDLTFARQHALSTGRTVWVVFDPASDLYRALEERVGSLGRSGAEAITDPATGRDFVRVMNSDEFVGVEIIGVSIGGGTEIGFDWRGRPRVNGSAFLETVGTVQITGGTISIEPETGLARHD
ncbi:MAG: Tfp pilus assembly protein FimT/FimU [Phycisphaerales bacterium]